MLCRQPALIQYTTTIGIGIRGLARRLDRAYRQDPRKAETTRSFSHYTSKEISLVINLLLLINNELLKVSTVARYPKSIKVLMTANNH